MPSGRTHDKITLYCLPIVTGISIFIFQSPIAVILAIAAFGFAGFLFGPDLDLYSCQYKRWGVLRWLWLPYQKAFRHRSAFSHGPIIGTLIRVAYLAAWIIGFAVCGIVVWSLLQQQLDASSNWKLLAQTQIKLIVKGILNSLNKFQQAWLAVGFGLEAGSLSHYCADWIGSELKKLKK